MSDANIKIGVLTYTSNFNYGTFFQAHATLRLLRQHFPNAHVEVINCHSSTKYEQVGYGKLNLRKRHLKPRNLINHLRKQRNYRDTQSRYLEFNAHRGFFSDSYEQTSHYIEQQAYDLVVVGSDTVLNFYPWNFSKKELPIYWLPDNLRAKKVMLSSSIGTDLPLDRLSDDEQAGLKRSIAGFSMIGVRDSLTLDFIRSLAPESITTLQQLPDPTLSYQLDSSATEAYLRRRRLSFDAPLIGLDLPAKVIGVEAAIKHFKRQGYQVATWRGHSKYADFDFSDMSPIEWSGIFAYFALTLTNRFHASIFSLKNATPVITLDYKANRITAEQHSKSSLLLDSFGLKDSHYANALTLHDDQWVTHAMQQALEAPQSDHILGRAREMHQQLDDYTARIGQLFD